MAWSPHVRFVSSTFLATIPEAQRLLKTLFVLHLSASEDLVLFTLAFNAIAFLRALTQRALVYSALLAAKTRWRRVQVFLSYRVDTDLELVEQLYPRLKALRLRVWLDRKELKEGLDWEAGFADGLFGSQVFVSRVFARGFRPLCGLHTSA